MKKSAISLAVVLSLAGLAGCQSHTSQTEPVVAPEVKAPSFEQFSASFIDSLWELSPTCSLIQW